MISKRLFQPGFAAGILLACLVGATDAKAFLCYIPTVPESPVALREKPNDTARIVARMPPGGMVRSVDRIKERNGWVYVHWMSDQATRKVTGKGWVRHLQIYGGECED